MVKILKMVHEIWPKFGGLDCLTPLPHQPPGIPWDNSENWKILIFVPKNGPILGKTFQKSGVAAKRCVLQGSYWSANLIFRTFFLLESCFVVNPDNFFIAKSDLNLKCVESERVKNMEIWPWRPNGASYRGHTEAPSCFSAPSHTRKVY